MRDVLTRHVGHDKRNDVFLNYGLIVKDSDRLEHMGMPSYCTKITKILTREGRPSEMIRECRRRVESKPTLTDSKT